MTPQSWNYAVLNHANHAMELLKTLVNEAAIVQLNDDVANALKTLATLTELQKSLVNLVDDTDDLIQSVRDTNAPRILKRGLDSLPDELLAHVYEMGYKSSQDRSKFALRVAHTCSRFRQVAFATPILWSMMTNTQSLEERESFLRRAGDVDLTIGMNERPLDSDDEEIREFVQFFVSVSHRCKAFFFHIWALNYEGSGRELQHMERLTNGLFLPRLKSIEVWGCGFYDEDVSAARFFETSRLWILPSLKHFNGIDAVPHLEYCPSLESCHISFDADSPSPWNFLPLLNSIKTSHTPSLRFLSLELNNMNAFDPPLSYPSTTLSSLLELELKCYDASPLSVAGVMECIKFPVLAKLFVEFESRFDDDNTGTAEACIPKPQHCPLLRHATIVIKGSIAPGDRVLVPIFCRLLQVHHLDIQVPFINVTLTDIGFPNGSIPVTSLQTVSFSATELIERSFKTMMEYLRVLLRARSFSRRLKKARFNLVESRQTVGWAENLKSIKRHMDFLADEVQINIHPPFM